jgi:molybdopterin molybdotransferase
LNEIEVGLCPRVAIVSTGDELAAPGATLRPGQIFESNAVMLEALVRRAGAVVRLIEHCPDKLDQLTEVFRRGLETDALVISGGVSVGERDLVKPVLHKLGAEIDLWRVAIKPGKPFLFGRADGCSIFGLPGNPVSAFVTFLRFVRPALLKLSGAANEHLVLEEVPARVASTLSNDGDRPHYLRGRLEGGIFSATGRQESHALFGLSRANALLRVPPKTSLSAGATAMVTLLA